MKKLILSAIALLAIVSVEAQETGYLENAVVNGDTMPMVTLAEVNVMSPREFANSYEAAKFEKLKRQVISVYPYAMMAKKIYFGLEDDLAQLDRKRKKRRHIKHTEQELRDKFEAQLKDLTRTQGRILVKLVNRETGNNCYDLIKELKSGITAVFYQNFGKFYGYDLKEHYDPKGVDADIEYIVQSIENGFIQLTMEDLEQSKIEKK